MDDPQLNPYAVGDCAERSEEIEYEVRVRVRAYVTLLPPVLATAAVGIVGGVVFLTTFGETRAIGGLLAGVGVLALTGFGYGFASIRWQFPRIHWLLFYPLVPAVVSAFCAVDVLPREWMTTSVSWTLWACGVDALVVGLVALAGWGALARFPLRASVQTTAETFDSVRSSDSDSG